MNLDLTEEQKLLQKSVREFAESEVKPLAKELDETGHFPRETFKKAAELGLTGVALPAARAALPAFIRRAMCLGSVFNDRDAVAPADFQEPPRRLKYSGALARGMPAPLSATTTAERVSISL